MDEEMTEQTRNEASYFPSRETLFSSEFVAQPLLLEEF